MSESYIKKTKVIVLQSDQNKKHAHTLSNHTHGMSNHTHDLSNHTHSLSDHTHDLSNHTHNMNHVHDRGNMNITGSVMSAGSSPTNSYSGAFYEHSNGGEINLWDEGWFGYVKFSADRTWSGFTSGTKATTDWITASDITDTQGPSNNTSGTPSNNTSGTPSNNTSGTPSNNTSEGPSINLTSEEGGGNLIPQMPHFKYGGASRSLRGGCAWTF